MKKILSVLLTATMMLSLVACAKSGTSSSVNGKLYTTIFTSDIETLDYLVTDKSINNEHFSNFVDALYENDRFGNIVPALAESMPEVNEDSSKFTIKLRKGVKWVTSTGEEYGEVTAEDFVTAIQHALDFESSMNFLLTENIKNAAAYAKKEVGIDQVGVKALDSHTLEYTLTGPVPYFNSLLLYSVFLPVNKQFLEGKGEGCKLGAPNKDKCEFGKPTPDGILYNGPFLLTVNDSKSKIEYVKNQAYWDKDNVHIGKVVQLYDDGKDPYSVIKGFEAGIYQSAAISARWKDFDKYKSKYGSNIIKTRPNATEFGMNLNFNRQNFETSKKTKEQHAETKKAILNYNFRRALQHAFDRVGYLRQSMPEDMAISSVRNMNNYPEIVNTSDGTEYGTLVTAAFQKMTKTDISLADGQDPFLSPEKAMEHIEKAKAEGVKFPVTLDYMYITGDSEVYVNRAQSLKDSIEKNTQGNILIELHGLQKDLYQKKNFLFEDPKEADYDLNTFSGWGPDFADPKTFADTYSLKHGALLKLLGLAPVGQDEENDKVVKHIGLDKFQELLDKADAIKTDLDARYKAYAEADAYLIANSIHIPMQMQVRGYLITKTVPFTSASGETGIMSGKSKRLKFTELQENIVTVEQYNEAYAKWQQERKVKK